MTDPTLISVPEQGIPVLLAKLGNLIRQARRWALRSVDTIQVQTCWELGRHIVEFEQGRRRTPHTVSNFYMDGQWR